MNRRNLDIVHHQPPAHPQLWEQVREFHLRPRIRMRPIQQHQVQLAVALPHRHGVLRLSLHERHAISHQIEMIAQPRNRPILPLDRERRVPLAHLRKHDCAPAAPRLRRSPERSALQDRRQRRRRHRVPGVELTGAFNQGLISWYIIHQNE
jgi:hypothetical protein